MVVLYANVCPELNSSEIHYLKVQEQYVFGNTFLIDGEIATPFFALIFENYY